MLIVERDGAVVLQTGADFFPAGVELMERKGHGHPDTLADDLAEELSRAYALHTVEVTGAVLHHNFDKLCLLGGASSVTYGSGRLTRAVRVLVNGRAALSFASQPLGVEDLIVRTCHAFFAGRLPRLRLATDLRVELNLSTASSPGRVETEEAATGSYRHRWFHPRTLADLPERTHLLANDTSFGTAYAPRSAVETFVLGLSDYLSRRPRNNCPDWLGTDVKLMACAVDRKVDIIACVPQIADCVPSRSRYLDNLDWLRADCADFVLLHAPELEVAIRFNVRDRPATDELYMTAIGSSIETGDEGVVGRGNRLNGLITPLRAMNIEGVSGKNPVYHVGKLYNIAAARLANQLHNLFGGKVVVNLISATGTSLAVPWRVVINMEARQVEVRDVVNTVDETLATFPEITSRILSEGPKEG